MTNQPAKRDYPEAVKSMVAHNRARAAAAPATNMTADEAVQAIANGLDRFFADQDK